MNPQEIRRSIREWKRKDGKIISPIGDIKLTKQLGEGGMAIVFDSDFADGSAVKFLTEEVHIPRSTCYKRFLSEYVNLVKLVSTGAIVPLYFFGIQNLDGDLQVPYIVMECCSSTLHSKYKADKLDDVDDFKKLLERLLVVLEVIHNAGIIHRDIKPKNILLRPNGDWVLADLGIAWFDNETYRQSAKTKNSDRLANSEFSPPEQRRRDAYENAVPSMDIFALGQTLYYCVTGQTIRGTGHTRFKQIAPSLAKYDTLITRMVRQNPADRFQSIGEVRNFLKKLEEDGSSSRLEQLKEFDKRLARAIPGSHYYTQAKDIREINRVLSSLAENVESYNLWWTRGGTGDLPIHQMEKLADEIWLVDGSEWKVIDLWIYRYRLLKLERNYVIVHLDALPSFGFADDDNSINRDEAGYFQGRYISFGEYEDGYAEIDGEIIEVNDAKPRYRNLEDDFLILSSNYSVYDKRINEEVLKNFYQKICEVGEINISILEILEDCGARYGRLETLSNGLRR